MSRRREKDPGTPGKPHPAGRETPGPIVVASHAPTEEPSMTTTTVPRPTPVARRATHGTVSAALWVLLPAAWAVASLEEQPHGSQRPSRSPRTGSSRRR